MFNSLFGKEEVQIHICKSAEPIIIPVKTTVLKWCMTIKKEHIIESMHKESWKDLLNKQGKKGIINIGVNDQNNNRIVTERCSCHIYNGNVRIVLEQGIKIALAKLFPITSAIVLCKEIGESFPVEKTSMLSESIKIRIVQNQDPHKSGLILSPHKVCTSEQIFHSKQVGNSYELGVLTKIIEDLMNTGMFNVTPQKGKRTHGHTDNTIIKSTGWKMASEYGPIDRAMGNCIYFLANEENKQVYVGEAISMGGRVKTKKIKGVTYIGHNIEDMEQYKFTKYRIDKLPPSATRDILHSAQDNIIGALTLMDINEFPNGFTMTNDAYNQAYTYVLKQNIKRGK